ncbi:MAG: zinc-ribbon domain-containing protein, partial [Tomitella sp.]|nr:zinc-ribbon domain-containing protein [Tomitella sp.]
MIADHVLRRFRGPRGHHPRITPITFRSGGCPHCRAQKSKETRANPSLAEELPEIAGQWHPDKNGGLTPATVPHNSKRTVWWRDPHCGHEWQESIRARDKYQRRRCQRCDTILDSLGYQYPSLAGEWSSTNPKTAWQVRPSTTSLDFTPLWVCSTNAEHQWQAPLPSRISGAECPDCRQAGKSQIELDHYAAAKRIFGAARSGQTARSDAFVRRPSWTIDITVRQPDDVVVAIEYDGAYWHEGKMTIDQDKTRDLIAAGHRVVRLREHPLLSLGIDDENYLELTVYANAPNPDGVLHTVAEWCQQHQRHPGEAHRAE